MLRRRFGLALVSVGLLTAMTVSSAVADTVNAPIPFDDYLTGTSFTFTSGGVAWSGIGQIEQERISHQTFVSFFFAGDGPAVTCDGGTPTDPTDDYIAHDRYEFYATTWKIADFKVKADLGKADLTVALKGKRVTTQACTDLTLSIKNESHVFCFDLKATAPGDPQTDVQVVTTPDGTFQLTDTGTYRPAAGEIRIDGRLVHGSDGSIQHAVQTVVKL